MIKFNEYIFYENRERLSISDLVLLRLRINLCNFSMYYKDVEILDVSLYFYELYALSLP